MRTLLFLFLFLTATCSAEDWIGLGPGVLKNQHEFSGFTSGYVFSVERVEPTHVVSVTFMERVNVDRQIVASIQRRFGRKVYFSIGPGITKATNRNTVLNLCGGFGVGNGRYSLAWGHCSNFDIRMPNRGIDYFHLKRRM